MLCDAGTRESEQPPRCRPVEGVDLVQQLEEADRLPDELVVHVGSNGPIREGDMADLVEAVADVESVLLLTSAIDSDLAASDNELIFATAAANDNIEVLDWDGLAASCSGVCFFDDDIHMRPDGERYYADLIVTRLET